MGCVTCDTLGGKAPAIFGGPLLQLALGVWTKQRSRSIAVCKGDALAEGSLSPCGRGLGRGVHAGGLSVGFANQANERLREWRAHQSSRPGYPSPHPLPQGEREPETCDHLT